MNRYERHQRVRNSRVGHGIVEETAFGVDGKGVLGEAVMIWFSSQDSLLAQITGSGPH